MADKLTDAEQQAKEAVDSRIENTTLQSRMSVLQNENKRLRDKFNSITKDSRQKETQMQNTIDENLKQIDKLNENLEKSEIEKSKLEQEKEAVREEGKVEKQNQKKEMQVKYDQLDEEYNRLAKNVNDFEQFKKDKKVLDDSVNQLTIDLEREKKERSAESQEKEREKIQATEKLRKEMLYKIKETKANLLALNDEQLQTTTRLTILQNHQLTTELEYQSKQTEQLLYRNNKMKTQIETLKRDIQIHKEVEKELAKRSHFCQKVIKRLKLQVKDLEAEKNDMSPMNSPAVRGMGGSSRKQPGGKNFSMDQGNNKANDDLINFLEQKIDEFEKKLDRTQKLYSQLQGEYSILQDKMSTSSEKYKRAALLMTEFLDDLLSSTPNILDSDKDMHLNLEKIKSTPLEQLDKEDKVALVLVLLKQLQPYLSSQNLSTANQYPNQGQPQYNHEQYVSNQADQILQNHGAHGTAHEVDALSSILNNINVQTKNGQGQNFDGRLPPI